MSGRRSLSSWSPALWLQIEIIITTSYRGFAEFPFEIPVRVSTGFCDSRKLGDEEVGLKRLLIRPGFPDSAEDDMGWARLLRTVFLGLSVIQTRTYNLPDSWEWSRARTRHLLR